ncbi:MAG: hypothetical protein COT59_00070 [Candidatus Nealsonbacteria bacterium CG09_land_8_20_14_0_10_42_14]|uniref:Uncharacterized protein n=1 Tax=Candidatus Nealsonbacteria bacterium CG09_land_8_20_14_0_10_42_14 TaxID=1974707 RepID=A0A2H0WY83_9BACT|nr:MAG: hypothetical protein COT59_00070 [Candidatus Nealsonbacteria bacterium CG09_land_8_20_14_0_10_42_14]
MKVKIIIGLLVFLLIGSGVGLWFVCQEKGQLAAGIVERDAVIEKKNAGMTEYTVKISDLEKELVSAKTQVKEDGIMIDKQEATIDKQTKELDRLKSEAAGHNAAIAERDAKITEKNTQLQELSDVIRRLETKLGRSAGLIIPTYQEVIDFVAMDFTNKHKYVIPDYQIINFAADLNNSAEKWGFRAATVYLKFTSYQPWYLVAFETTDKGIIYISPTTDEVAPEPVIGESFKLESWTKSYEVERIIIAW